MTDPIRAALEKAAEELWREAFRLTQGIEKPESWAERSEDLKQKWRRMAAVGSNAFLRSLPDQYTQGGAAFWDAIPLQEETRLWLAEAVLAAAKDQPND